MAVRLVHVRAVKTLYIVVPSEISHCDITLLQLCIAIPKDLYNNSCNFFKP